MNNMLLLLGSPTTLLLCTRLHSKVSGAQVISKSGSREYLPHCKTFLHRVASIRNT
jgi:hypothetical protein